MKKRFHLFEFEDLQWFPVKFRNFITDLLGFQINYFNIYGPALEKITKISEKLDYRNIIDLCSGSGGAILKLHQELMQKKPSQPFSIMVSDKYPNLDAFKKISNPTIQPIMHSIDATDVPSQLKGFRTLFTAFHHFRPQVAKQILQDAVDKNTAIGVFEITERNWASLLTLVIAPIAALLFTPFVRPFKISRFFWTYLIPIIPILYTWDGLISNFRSYTPHELERMVQSIKTDHYKFEIGTMPSRFHIKLTYLIGYPTEKKAM